MAFHTEMQLAIRERSAGRAKREATIASSSPCPVSPSSASTPRLGAQKFSVPFGIPGPGDGISPIYEVQPGIIAGDGYYYVAFEMVDSFSPDTNQNVNHLALLRVSSS